MEAFESALREKANRSLLSFEKQLKILGFKKHREMPEDIKIEENEGEDDRIGLKYYWRGRKEENLNKELGFIDKHLTEFIAKIAHFREIATECKDKLDKNFENCLFTGLRHGVESDRAQNKLRTTIQMATETVNLAHKTSGDLVRDVQRNLEDEISLLRLLTFRHGELYDD
jgi:hypothetical protein